MTLKSMHNTIHLKCSIIHSFVTWNSWRQEEKLLCTHMTHLSHRQLFILYPPNRWRGLRTENIVIRKQSQSNERGDRSHGKTAAWQMGVWEIGPAFPLSHWWSRAFCQYIRFDEKLGEIKPPPWGNYTVARALHLCRWSNLSPRWWPTTASPLS